MFAVCTPVLCTVAEGPKMRIWPLPCHLKDGQNLHHSSPSIRRGASILGRTTVLVLHCSTALRLTVSLLVPCQHVLLPDSLCPIVWYGISSKPLKADCRTEMGMGWLSGLAKWDAVLTQMRLVRALKASEAGSAHLHMLAVVFAFISDQVLHESVIPEFALTGRLTPILEVATHNAPNATCNAKHD